MLLHIDTLNIPRISCNEQAVQNVTLFRKVLHFLFRPNVILSSETVFPKKRGNGMQTQVDLLEVFGTSHYRFAFDTF